MLGSLFKVIDGKIIKYFIEAFIKQGLNDQMQWSIVNYFIPFT
jgi:hypothetical protein